MIAPPYPISVREGVPGLGLSMLEDRIQNKPPCQTLNIPNLYSNWDGDWLGPEFQLEESIRTGWSFVPSNNMNCKIETFTTEMIRRIPEKKSIYILGRSIERGVFLSLVDLMLDLDEKKNLGGKSVIGKCWGRATVRKGNLEVMYQDWRSNSFEDPTKPRFIECHNEKMVKQPGSSFIANATQVWEEIFQQEESNWPSVILMVTGMGNNQFMYEHHIQAFVQKLPPTWRGTLFLGDLQLSAVNGGMVSLTNYEEYVNGINNYVNALEDPRIRWIDSNGISKEMRMYGQNGEEFVARSQHFHRLCYEPLDEDDKQNAMVVCSNITEMVGQLLLGHALGPKAEFLEQVENNPNPPSPEEANELRWCHACPKCMLPFHIQPQPEMTCVDGPLLNTDEKIDCHPKKTGNDVENKDPMVCPDTCLKSEIVSEFSTESDLVHVRQCPI